MLPQSVINNIRTEYQHLSSIHFNTAYFGPSPLRCKKRVEDALSIEMDPSFYPYEDWISIPDNIRLKLGKILNCSADDIAHSTSTTDIISMVANGMDWKEGDIACAIDKDYPSDIIPWMVSEQNRPFTFKLLNLGDQTMPTATWLADHLPKKTKVFNISYVAFETGKKVDILNIGKLCRSRDILFVVDATQALGGLPISKEELAVIDVLACSSYKWMLGPYGHGFAYFSKLAQEKIHRQNGSWINSANRKVGSLLEYTTETQIGARCYDRGQAPNMLEMACLDGALDFLLEIGLEEIKSHNHELRDHFLKVYPKKNYTLITPKESMANIICLQSNQHIDKLIKNLKDANIDISIREGKLRLSFHIYNTIEQVEQLAKTLDI